MTGQPPRLHGYRVTVDFLSVAEVAYELGVERRDVYLLAESGELPLWQDGDQLLVKRQELDEFLRAQQREGEN